MLKNKLWISAAICASSIGISAPAGAEKASNAKGVGVCMAMIATSPEDTVGAPTLGAAARALAADGAVVTELDNLRNACGEPPFTGHHW